MRPPSAPRMHNAPALREPYSRSDAAGASEDDSAVAACVIAEFGSALVAVCEGAWPPSRCDAAAMPVTSSIARPRMLMICIISAA